MWARKWEYLIHCESAWLTRTDCAHHTCVAPSSTRRRGMLYLCISVANIEKEKECRRKAQRRALSQRKVRQAVYTLLTQRVTFVFRVIYVKSHSGGFGPKSVLNIQHYTIV